MTNEKPRHLGRGLESLLGPMPSAQPEPTDLPSAPASSKLPPDTERRESLHQLPLDSISPNPYQARTVWNEDDLAELTASIRANGSCSQLLYVRFRAATN